MIITLVLIITFVNHNQSVHGVSIGLFVMRLMTGTLSQTALRTFPIFYFLDVLLEICSLFFYVTLFILFLVSYIYIFFFILTLDLCRASLKTTLCDVGSLLKDLIYYYYYYYRNCCLYIIIQKITPQAKSGKYFQIWFFPRFGEKKWRRSDHGHVSYPGLTVQPL